MNSPLLKDSLSNSDSSRGKIRFWAGARRPDCWTHLDVLACDLIRWHSGRGDGAGAESAAPAAAVESACFGRRERDEGPCGVFAAAQAGGPRDAGA